MPKYVLSTCLFLLAMSCSVEEREAFDDFIEVVELFDSDDADENTMDGTGNNQGEPSTLTSMTADGIELLGVTGFGETVTINRDEKVDVLVSGSNNTINIEANLGELTVEGSNNFLYFSPNTAVELCSVTGSDNSAQKDESVNISCVILGSGNMGF